MRGTVSVMEQNYDRGAADAERAEQLGGHIAEVRLWIAAIYYLLGRREEALAAMRKANRLNPLPSYDNLNNLGIILYFVGRPEEAIPPLKKVYDRTGWMPTLVFLTASYVAVGRMEEAERQAAYFYRAEPERVLTAIRPYKFPADVRRVLDDLAKAGVK